MDPSCLARFLLERCLKRTLALCPFGPQNHLQPVSGLNGVNVPLVTRCPVERMRFGLSCTVVLCSCRSAVYPAGCSQWTLQRRETKRWRFFSLDGLGRFDLEFNSLLFAGGRNPRHHWLASRQQPVLKEPNLMEPVCTIFECVFSKYKLNKSLIFPVDAFVMLK